MRIANIKTCLIISLLFVAVVDARAQTDWLQWGGPNRDFTSTAKGLAASWPATGPKPLWSRPLGGGHSAVLASGKNLYTMYSQGEQETVIALAADTGKTIWEHKYAAPTAGLDLEYGAGPHSTPIIVGELIYTVGSTGKLFALNTNNGKVVWEHDLWKEYGGTKMGRGYSCSPVAYKDTIILTLGGKGQTLVAFNQKDGSVAWKNQTLDLSPSSPMLINVDGQDQLLMFLGGVIAGLDPNNGNLLWSHPHVTDWGLNITMPIWGKDNLLFISSAYNGGSRVLKLAQKDGKTTAQELWFQNKMRVHHSTAIRVGDHVYGSSGDFGPAFFAAINVKTGEISYQDRRFPKTNFLLADGKFIMLDEDGNLALATATPQGLTVISKVSIMKNLAWTVPTLAGTKLYLRDRRTIAAFDLGH
jgi:outer membrane protein assembly factor BamB